MSKSEPVKEAVAASFRDPSGFVYKEDGVILRQVNIAYKEAYEKLMNSGLYERLVGEGLLVPHKEIAGKGYKTLQPEAIPFISHPHEWSFGQLQDAALATLRIQHIALEYGMSLKDASAYNVQFSAGRPVLIDTLSFEPYTKGRPWIAYRQFCQHFLAPLALIAHVDLRLGTFSASYIDGIPLDLAARLLPASTRFSLGLGPHIHLHARSQRTHADAPSTTRHYELSQPRLLGLLDSLRGTVQALRLPRQKTVWDDYYDKTNYSQEARLAKHATVKEWTARCAPATAWDAGANDGTFSRLAAEQGALTVASDIDPVAVDHDYGLMKQRGEKNLLPLIIDLTTPSPAIGWRNTERPSFLERADFDLALCLALIHHLAIANNLPLSSCAQLFSRHSRWLIIEFVPKDDSNAQRLLAAREDIFPDYTVEGFEKAFSDCFSVVDKRQVPESSRILYLMERKGTA